MSELPCMYHPWSIMKTIKAIKVQRKKVIWLLCVSVLCRGYVTSCISLQTETVAIYLAMYMKMKMLLYL